MKSHDERDVLRELFPGTARELFGSASPTFGGATLGLHEVADGKLALVRGDRLLELEPVETLGKRAAHCDLCHATRSRGEVGIYRAQLAPGRFRYLTLCLSSRHCQSRAGARGLATLADALLSAN